MISKKIFLANGINTRYLSDFIIRSEQFARPYVYIYDNTLAENGSEDQLVDGSTDQADWSWPDNIWKRGSNIPQAGDIVTEDKWQVVDNSVLFYLPPIDTSSVWLEVATTAEEFGDTLIDASVEEARLAAVESQEKVWEAEAEALTADSYANQLEDVFVDSYSSDGDGTFTTTPTIDYSSFHYSKKAETFNPALYALLTGATFTGQVKGITPVAVEDLTRKDYVDGEITALNLESGTYTPTATAVTNVDSTTAQVATYFRVGDIVTVSGTVDIDPTVATTSTIISLSLPIAPSGSFTATTDGNGIANEYSENMAGEIYTSISSQLVILNYTSIGTASKGFSYVFNYKLTI